MLLHINGKIYTPEVYEILRDDLLKFFPGENLWADELASFVRELNHIHEGISVFTSGTTGTPKEILLSYKLLTSSATASCNYFGLDNHSTALLCLPVTYIAGKMMIIRSLIAGIKLTVVPPKSNPFLINHFGCFDFAPMIPMQLMSGFEFADHYSSFKTILIGGGSVSLDMENSLCQISGTTFYHSFGMTETASHIAIRNISAKQTTYTAIGDFSFFQDERNCLCIKHHGLNGGQIITNDVVELISDTEFVWIGRFDNMVNSGGVKLFPEQIEKKLEGYIPYPYYITGKPSSIFGEQLVMIVEKENFSDKDEKDLFDILKTKLTKYEIPKRIIFCKKIERTSSEKLIRNIE